MTATTTQPDPQVVAWMREHMRDNPGADGAVALLAYLRHYDGALEMLPDRDMLLASARAANKPPTLADVPRGQGAASLFLHRDPAGVLHLMMQPATGDPVVVVWGEVAPTTGESALFAHLAATLRTVTTEEDA